MVIFKLLIFVVGISLGLKINSKDVKSLFLTDKLPR
jgi:hypothetical protein